MNIQEMMIFTRHIGDLSDKIDDSKSDLALLIGINLGIYVMTLTTADEAILFLQQRRDLLREKGIIK